jgi:hypothetical protein
MSITVSLGQLTGGANDLFNSYNAWANGTPVLPPTGYAEPAYTAFGGILSLAGELTSGPLGNAIGATAPLVAAINLAGAYSQFETARASGDDAAIVSSILGVTANLGNFFATIPIPQTRAIGTLVNLAAGAARAARDNGWRPSLGSLPEAAKLPPSDNINDPLGNPTGIGTFSPTTITQAQQLFYHIEFDLSPLILDLDGNGVSTRAVADGTYFDLNGNGLAESTGWVGAGDALLVRDINGNGVIDNGAELFGNNTLLANGSPAANGFAALAALDVNSDGQVNTQDADWSSLRLWKDSNANGITDAGELITLAAAGVQSLGTGYVADYSISAIDAQGNWHQQVGETKRRYVFNSCLRSNLFAIKVKFNVKYRQKHGMCNQKNALEKSKWI